MSQTIRFTEDDEGKRVVDSTGTDVGRIVDVRAGTAYVDPDPNLADTVLSKLGWAEADENSYPLDETTIEAVTDDEVRLSNFGERM